MSDPAVCDLAVKDCDILVIAHMFRRPNDAPYGPFNANVTGTANLMYAAHRAGVGRMVLISSIDAVIGNPPQLPRTATSPLMGRDIYSSTKGSREVVARGIHVEYGTPIAVLRIGYVVDFAEPGLRRGIEIRRSGIVLRGSGAGEGGTTLFMREMLLPVDPNKLWTVPAMFYFTPLEKELSSREILDPKGQPHTMLAEDVSEGRRRVVVADASGFAVGDVVSVAHESPALNPILLRGLATRDLWERVNTRGIACTEKHVIRKIEGNTLVFHAPVRMDLKAEQKWMVLRYPVLENCGFEDLHVEGNFLEPFAHHKNPRHDSGFTAVIQEACFNSWIRRCRLTNLSVGATLRGSLASAMLMNTAGGNPGHGCFNITFGTHNLLGLSRDVSGYFHGPDVSHLAVGNVVWRFRADTPHGGPDFHATFPRTTLWDASACRNRDNHGGNYQDLPNHLDGLTFWNFEHLGEAEQDVNFWDLLPDRPQANYGPLTVVKPLIVGYHGSDTTFEEGTVAGLHSLGRAVLPESLYEAQLALCGGRGGRALHR